MPTIVPLNNAAGAAFAVGTAWASGGTEGTGGKESLERSAGEP
jgi:hypothetical protein